MDIERSYVNYSAFHDSSSKDDFETAKQKQQNHLHNLALSAKWKNMGSGSFGTFPLHNTNEKDNPQNVKSSLFPNMSSYQSAFREDLKSFPISDHLLSNNNQQHSRPLSPHKRIITTLSDSETDNSPDEKDHKVSKVSSKLYSYGVDTPRSKASSVQSIQEKFLEKNTYTSKNFSGISAPSTIIEDEDEYKANEKDDDDIYRSETPEVDTDISESMKYGSINLTMLFGLFIGLLLSKALQYLQVYFSWFLYQVKNLRSVVLGDTTIWEFLNLDDNTRYRVRTKLLLMPVIGCCSLLYGLISVLHFAVRFLLASAPKALIYFIQKLQEP